MKPLHPDIEAALAALELDIATGKFKSADGLREAIRAWADTQIRLALRIAGVVVEPVVEYVVNAVLTPLPTDAADLTLTPSAGVRMEYIHEQVFCLECGRPPQQHLGSCREPRIRIDL